MQRNTSQSTGQGIRKSIWQTYPANVYMIEPTWLRNCAFPPFRKWLSSTLIAHFITSFAYTHPLNPSLIFVAVPTRWTKGFFRLRCVALLPLFQSSPEQTILYWTVLLSEEGRATWKGATGSLITGKRILRFDKLKLKSSSKLGLDFGEPDLEDLSFSSVTGILEQFTISSLHIRTI